MDRIKEEELIKQVRVTIDENQLETDYLKSDTNNLELDDIIRSKLPDAIRIVLENAPAWMVEGKPMSVQPSWLSSKSDGTGFIKMPDDFLRILKIKMEGWTVAVDEPVQDGTPVAIRQKCKHTRGNPIKPVCVLTINGTGNVVLEYYSVEPGRTAKVEYAIYVAKPTLVEQSYDIPSLLRSSIVNYCAALSLLSRNEPQAAEHFFTIAQSYFKGTPAG